MSTQLFGSPEIYRGAHKCKSHPLAGWDDIRGCWGCWFKDQGLQSKAESDSNARRAFRGYDNPPPRKAPILAKHAWLDTVESLKRGGLGHKVFVFADLDISRLRGKALRKYGLSQGLKIHTDFSIDGFTATNIGNH